ncbi:LOW QUALITY PROTEIN: CLDND2 isoform 3, partial [Pongo abelii]
VVGMVMGLRIRCHEGESLRGQTTSAFLFLGGLLLLTALIGSPAALPGNPRDLSGTPQHTNSRRPGRDPLGAPNPSPRGPPGHPPQGPPSYLCSATPSPQASAFCWQT